ncbi:unnamed protein product [Schistocephalus solidus]|uniref:Solute carrier family 22 member 21 n=1 Tax=Schistocephalus solidus TaxID=70667 RepID=A0A183SGX0_SCHSO|nr:unnamed protein product [Schistocephalus solidus]
MAANSPLSKTEKDKVKTSPALDGAKVDELLAEVVQPIGFWQIGLVLLNALSSPNTVVLSIFINSFPNHRCQMSTDIEAWFSNATTEAVNSTVWSIRQIAEIFSPLPDTSTITRACEIYSIKRRANSTVEEYIALFANASARGIPTEKCSHGFVYDYNPHQYPGGVVAEWNLVCSRAWEAPFNESAYMAGMCLGFVVGGWLSDRLGRRIAVLSTGMTEFIICLLACLSPHHMFYATTRFLIAACFSARVAVATVIAAELTTAKYRSILTAIGSVIQLTVHRMLIAILAYFVHSWRILTGCMFLLNSGVLILCFVLPESPKWLAARGRMEATGRSLYAGYRTNLRFANLFSKKANRQTCMSEGEFMGLIGPPCLPTTSETEEDEVRNYMPVGDVEVEMHASKHRHSSCWCRPLNCELVWTTFLAIILLTCHTISLYGMVFYSTHIRFHVSLVVAVNAVANMPGCFLSACLYRLFRFRKRPLLWLILIATTFQSIAALHTLILQPDNDILLNVFGNIILLLQTAGIMMLFVYVPELYTPLQRNRGFGLSIGVSRIGALAFPFINQLDVDVIHGIPLAIYAGISAIQLLVLLFLKDTNGEVMPPEEVDGRECTQLRSAKSGTSSEASQSLHDIA